MDIQKLLQGYDCSCGCHHSCDIGFVAIEAGAIAHLTRLCGGCDRILLVADENTFAAAGEQALAALAGKKITRVIFPGSTVLIPNEAAIDRVTAQLGENQRIVGIGSGVIQDLCKYVSFQSGVPYYIVATAPSMDGYASSGAAMITGGMKVTYSAKVPDAILADPAILKDAPMDMIQAGYGDIVGKFSALNDWKLSHLVHGEAFCQENYDLTYNMLQDTLKLADGLQKRDEESIRVLMEALVVVGIAMSFVGSSRPASGSEHHFSHYFEITGIVRNEEYLPHGIDVAYSTVITCSLREKLLQKQWPDTQFRPERSTYEAEMERIYGSVGSSCVALQDKMGRYEQNMAPVYKEKEAAIRALLAEVPTAAEIEAMLAAVGMDMGEYYKLYSTEKINDAILWAKDLKDRYTVLWMYFDLFGGEKL